MRYPVVSVFSGAMGLDLGLEMAGLNIVISQDIDPCCIQTMTENGKNCIPGDIRLLISQDPKCSFLIEGNIAKKEEVFAVVGGPPCQPFSTAGKRKSVDDPRGSLFNEFYHVLNTIRPRFFVMENVKGLASSKTNEEENSYSEKVDKTKGLALEMILDKFSTLKYKIVYGLVDAVYYGTPQFRERLLIIGSRENEDIFLPKQTHFQKHQSQQYRWQTLRQAIEDLEDAPGDYVPFSGDRLKYIKIVPAGGNWRDLPKDVLPTAMGGALDSGGGKVGFFRRLDYNQPSPTLVTSPTQKATMLCHPTKNRPLSVKEYSRIQGFPDNWRFCGKIIDQYRQIGNAVPLMLGKAIGEMLVSVARNQSEIRTKRTRGTSVHNVVLEETLW